MTKEIVIAITGLNNIDSPGPGIPVIRALKDSKKFKSRIIGLSYDTLEPGIYMRDHVDKVYQIPLPSAGTSILKERLEYIHKIEKIDVIIPNFDAELFNFIKIENYLREKLHIQTFLPTQEQFESRHKSVLYEFGKKCKVKVPYSRIIFNYSDIAMLERDFSYPLVIKGQYYDASIAATPEQARNYFSKISAKWGVPIIVQEFVSGNEVNVTALGDGNGKCIGAVAMRKLYITDKGKAWAGVSLEDENLIKTTHNVIKKSKWRGGCELEFIKTDKNEYYLLEMNPRFPAWVYLAIGCGQNHPEALVQLAMKQKITPFKEYEKGKMFIRYAYDLIVDMKSFEKISTKGEL